MPTTTAPADHVRVPSWQVTAAMLESWGFPVEKRGKCVGMQMVEKAGMPFGRALHAAWIAGFTEVRSMPDDVRHARRQAFHVTVRRQQEHAARTVAELRAAGTIHRQAA